MVADHQGAGFEFRGRSVVDESLRMLDLSACRCASFRRTNWGGLTHMQLRVTVGNMNFVGGRGVSRGADEVSTVLCERQTGRRR